MTHDASVGGIALVGEDGRQVRIWIQMHMFLQDGAAHKYLWNCKGDSGSNICMLCRGVVAGSAGYLDEEEEECDVRSASDEADQTDEDDVYSILDEI